MALKVTVPLMKEHGKCRHNQKQAPVAKYKVGDALWLDCTCKISERREVTYYIPAEVQKRLGEDIYTLKVGKRLFRDRHHSQMKPGVPDPKDKHVQFDHANVEVDEDNPLTEEHG